MHNFRLDWQGCAWNGAEPKVNAGRNECDDTFGLSEMVFGLKDFSFRKV